MAQHPVESELEKCFHYFEKKAVHSLSKQLMQRIMRVYDHYVGEDKKNIQTLDAFLQHCMHGNWTKAESLFIEAKDEYERYIRTNSNKNQRTISRKDNMEHINLQTPDNAEGLDRRSKDASVRLIDNNPAITDMSDPNRSIKLAERFSELYSNEYTDAFEELNSAKYREHEIIQYLLSIVKSAIEFCKTRRHALIDGPMSSKKLAAEDQVARYETFMGLRKDAEEKVHDVKKDFIAKTCPRISQTGSLQDKTRKYAEQCVEIVWFMSIQQLPLQLEFIDTSTEKKKFNENRYRAYTRSGNFVEFCVWPVLLLHENGPILTKGIAQGCS